MKIIRQFAVPLLLAAWSGSATAQAGGQGVPAPRVPIAVVETGTHAGSVLAWDVTASGTRLATAGDDKTVRIWSLPSLAPIAVLRPPQGDGDDGRPLAVAINADATRVASLVARGAAVALYVFELPSGSLLAPAIRTSADAVFLEYAGAGELLMGARSSAGAKLFALDRDGARVVRDEPGDARDPRFAGRGAHVRFAGGSRIEFGPRGAIRMLSGAGATHAAIESQTIEFAAGSLRVARDGAAVEFADRRGERYAFSVDPAGFVDGALELGGTSPPAASAPRRYAAIDGGLRATDSGGRELWKVGFDHPVQVVATSPGGETVVAGLADGTLHWLQTRDGAALLTLFIHRSEREWMLWNPGGYYTSSPYGDKYVGWLATTSDERAAEFVLSQQLERVLYRPDFVGCTVRCLGPERPRYADLGQPIVLPALAQFAPPKVRITAITPIDERRQRIGFVAEASRLPILDWNVLVNGVPVVPYRDRQLPPASGARLEREVIVEAAGAVSTVRVEVFNGRTMGLAETVLESRAPVLAAPRGDLYLLAIGVNEFPELPKELQLLFSATDAGAVANLFGKRLANRFNKTNVKLIADGLSERPEKQTIIDSLRFLWDAGPNDTVVIFLASHAVSDRAGNYYFAPRGVKADDLVLLRDGKLAGEGSMIAWTRFVDGLRVVAGRRLLVVDTCHAEAIRGKVDLASLVKRSAAAHFGILTASKSDELAMELDTAKHGLFTYSLLRGLYGEADTNRDQRITVRELYAHLGPTMERFRPDRKLPQTPQLVAPQVILDHVLAEIRQ